MDPVHDRGSMDPVQSGGSWTPGPCFVLTRRAFVFLSVPAVGQLSILLEAVNVVPFSIFHLKIHLFS